jgi:hypothetical protein
MYELVGRTDQFNYRSGLHLLDDMTSVDLYWRFFHQHRDE